MAAVLAVEASSSAVYSGLETEVLFEPGELDDIKVYSKGGEVIAENDTRLFLSVSAMSQNRKELGAGLAESVFDHRFVSPQFGLFNNASVSPLYNGLQTSTVRMITGGTDVEEGLYAPLLKWEIGMIDFIDKKKRQAHNGEVFSVELFIFIFLAGGCFAVPAMFSALMYELGIIESWTTAGNGPSFGLWYLPMLIYVEYLGILFLTKIKTKKVIYCYDENGTPNLIGIIKYPLLTAHLLAMLLIPFIFHM